MNKKVELVHKLLVIIGLRSTTKYVFSLEYCMLQHTLLFLRRKTKQKEEKIR